MALIRCAECGHQVSDKATTCPMCGNPIQEQIAEAKTMNIHQMYCDTCGASGSSVWWRKQGSQTCVFCKSSFTLIAPYTKQRILEMRSEESSTTYDSGNPDPVNDWLVRHIVIKDPSFKATAYQQRLNIQREHNISENTIEQYWRNKAQQAQASNAHQAAITASKPKCPHCGSTNFSKISTLGRAASVSLFGLASSKMGKTFSCNKCGYKW